MLLDCEKAEKARRKIAIDVFIENKSGGKPTFLTVTYYVVPGGSAGSIEPVSVGKAGLPPPHFYFTKIFGQPIAEIPAPACPNISNRERREVVDIRAAPSFRLGGSQIHGCF